MNSLNPFGFIFAERFLSDEDPCYIKYKKEETIYNRYCLPHTLTHSIACHYASVYFKIVKNTRKGLWTEEVISYETHYISVSYFICWLKLPISQFMDIDVTKNPVYTFSRDCPHPLNKPIIFVDQENVSYLITVEDINYPRKNCVSRFQKVSSEKDNHANEDSDIIVKEYDPMQWY